jgi:hypothetical protein
MNFGRDTNIQTIAQGYKTTCYLVILGAIFKKSFRAGDIAQWWNTCLARVRPWALSLTPQYITKQNKAK